MASAGDIINGALRLIGQLAEGEVPTDEQSNDALLAMNQMLDSWSTESLAVYTTIEQVLTWPVGQAVQTLGPTGTLVGQRPIQLQDATYFVDPTSGVSYRVSMVNEEEYNGIAFKSSTSTYPQVLQTNYDFPNITMKVFPVPTKALEWHFVSVLPLAQPAVLATELEFPPGYLRAFRYCLACELAPEFGVEPSPTVRRVALISKRNLKRINQDQSEMSVPYALVTRTPRYNVFSGSY